MQPSSIKRLSPSANNEEGSQTFYLANNMYDDFIICVFKWRLAVSLNCCDKRVGSFYLKVQDWSVTMWCEHWYGTGLAVSHMLGVELREPTVPIFCRDKTSCNRKTYEIMLVYSLTEVHLKLQICSYFCWLVNISGMFITIVTADLDFGCSQNVV